MKYSMKVAILVFVDLILQLFDEEEQNTYGFCRVAILVFVDLILQLSEFE